MKPRGFTLLETLVVVFIVGIIASVVLPQFTPSNSYKLKTASNELANALRFARVEAIRTATPHGVDYTDASKLLQVYRLDTTSTHQYDVYHPVDKKLLWLDYSTTGDQAPVQLDSVTLQYGGNATNRIYISFDEYGTPRFLNGTLYDMLDNATIILSDAGQTSTITVSPMTGRVTVL